VVTVMSMVTVMLVTVMSMVTVMLVTVVTAASPKNWTHRGRTTGA